MRAEQIVGDVRHGWRLVRRRPGLAAAVWLSLGIGVGANTTMFAWIHALVFRPIPGVADATAFHHVEPRTDGGGYPGTSWLEYQDLRERLRTMSDLVAARVTPLVVGESGRPERVFGLLVSGNYFEALGLRPAAGRFITPAEASRPGGEPVAVISQDFWRSTFGGDPAAIGTTLRINGRPFTIVGAAPEGFQGTVLGLRFDVWIPATTATIVFPASRELDQRGSRGYMLIGRLAPGATLDAARGEVGDAMSELEHDHPDTNAKVTADVLTFWEALRGPQRFLVDALAVAEVVMAILLLAVCANIANLVLARASGRQREMGVRMAIGAGTGRIVALVLIENVVLALPGGLIGVALAFWGTAALAEVRLTTAFPVHFVVGLDATGLGFALGLTILCGLLFGVAPALQLSRVRPQTSLASGASTASGRRMRDLIMGTEVALALLLLIVAAAAVQGYASSRATDPGFNRDGTLLAAYDSSGRNLDAPATRDFMTRLLDRLRALPGVESAAVALQVPLDIHGFGERSFVVEGRRRADGVDDSALVNTVTDGYFRTMGIPMTAGADFSPLDDRTAPPEVIVNQAFVDRYLAGTDAVGRRLESGGTTFTIVGVVRTTVSNAFGEPPTPVIYLSYRDRLARSGEIHVATRPGSELLLANEVRRVVRDLDPDLPLFNVRTMAGHIETNLVLQRLPAQIFVVVGPLLLLLAAIGIYAVVAYSVAQRKVEIGVRMALGAVPQQVVSQFVRETVGIVLAGAVTGWLIAFVVALDVVHVAALDTVMFVGVPMTLLAVAVLAAWVPARRTSAIEPAEALRPQ